MTELGTHAFQVNEIKEKIVTKRREREQLVTISDI